MQVYIVHGFEAYPQKHWFMWLRDELSKQHVSTYIPAMPNAANPIPEEWDSTLQSEVKNIDKNTYFIGHSLGCIATLRFLSILQERTQIGGIILVSGFDKSLDSLPQLNHFMNINLEYNKLCSLTAQRLVISARNDNIVPTQLSQILAQNLRATFIQTDTGGHFMQDDNFTSFPLLFHQLTFFFANNS
ncbi:serine hydrolase family protein [Helicobacter aurati]|uniref:Serine hydrolase family protein n=1 Tax=Helicobacter aurati TaxID=137778 RepID=A0A3D8J179_9HELI|nr:alpha/beta hydrolase [Helicobacter aurati]RDU71267.1 serine hydrolase family protein [Helicobacter aurati]